MENANSSPLVVVGNGKRHAEMLQRGLYDMFWSSRGVDLDFRWGGEAVTVHKCVADIFLSPTKLGTEPDTQIDHSTNGKTVLAFLLEFLYKGEVALPQGQLNVLLGAARELDFKLLEDAIVSVKHGAERRGSGADSESSSCEFEQTEVDLPKSAGPGRHKVTKLFPGPNAIVSERHRADGRVPGTDSESSSCEFEQTEAQSEVEMQNTDCRSAGLGPRERPKPCPGSNSVKRRKWKETPPRNQRSNSSPEVSNTLNSENFELTAFSSGTGISKTPYSDDLARLLSISHPALEKNEIPRKSARNISKLERMKREEDFERIDKFVSATEDFSETSMVAEGPSEAGVSKSDGRLSAFAPMWKAVSPQQSPGYADPVESARGYFSDEGVIGSVDLMLPQGLDLDSTKERSGTDNLSKLKGNKTFTCTHCNTSLTSSSSLARHKTVLHGVGPSRFTCKTCGRRSASHAELMRHERSHHDTSKCPHCSVSYEGKGQLTRHISSVHGLGLFNCEACSKSFSRKDILSRHIRTHHP